MQETTEIQQKKTIKETDSKRRIDMVIRPCGTCEGIRLNLGKFVILPEEFNSLRKLAVVEEFFMLDDVIRSAVERNISIQSAKGIKFGIECAIWSIYNVVRNINPQHEDSLNVSGSSNSKIFNAVYSFDIQTDIKRICHELNVLELVFNINNFGDLMKTMKIINCLHLKVLGLFPKTTLNLFGHLLPDFFCNSFLRGIAIEKTGSPDHEWVPAASIKKSGIIEEFLEKTDRIIRDLEKIEQINKDTECSEYIYVKELYIKCKGEEVIQFDKSQNAHWYLFNSLKCVIDRFLIVEFKSYSKLDRVLCILEGLTEVLYNFFFKDSRNLLNSPVAVNLSQFFVRMPKVLMVAILNRYCGDPRILKIKEVIASCVDVLKIEVNNIINGAKNKPSSANLMKKIYNLVLEVIDFRKELNKFDYCRDGFDNVIDLFEVKFNDIKSGLNSVHKNKEKTTAVKEEPMIKKQQEQTINMEQEQVVVGGVLSSKIESATQIRKKLPNFRLTLGSFHVTLKEFNNLRNLEVVEECFLLVGAIRSTVKSGNSVPSKDTWGGIDYAIRSIYNTVVNIIDRYEGSMNNREKKIQMIFTQRETSGIKQEIENICNELGAFGLVFNINNFDELMKIMTTMNEFYLRALRLFSKIIINLFKGLLPDLFRVSLVNGIITHQTHSPDYKYIFAGLAYNNDIIGNFLENINRIKEGFCDVYPKELFIKLENAQLIKLNRSQNQLWHLFDGLRDVMDGFLVTELKSYSEFDKILCVIEKLMDVLYKFFSKGSANFFDDPIYVSLGGLFSQISTSFSALIGVPHYFTPARDADRLITKRCMGFKAEVDEINQCTPNKSILMKNIHDFVSEVMDFRQKLSKLKYCDEDFWKVIDEFRSKCKAAQSISDSVNKDGPKIIIVSQEVITIREEEIKRKAASNYNTEALARNTMIYLGKFDIELEQFNDLCELAIVDEFFSFEKSLCSDMKSCTNKIIEAKGFCFLNNASYSNVELFKTIRSESIATKILHSINSVFRSESDIHNRYLKIIDADNMEKKSVSAEDPKDLHIKTEVKSICNEINLLEPVVAIRDFDDLKKEMQIINGLHLRIMCLLSEVVIRSLKSTRLAFCSTFIRAIIIIQGGFWEYKFISKNETVDRNALSLSEDKMVEKEDNNMIEKFFENINLIKNGLSVCIDGSFAGIELSLHCNKPGGQVEVVALDASQHQHMYLFFNLGTIINGFSSKGLKNYSEFDVLLSALEETTNVLYQFLLRNSNILFSSALGLRLISDFFMDICRKLVVLINTRYYCDPKVTKIEQIVKDFGGKINEIGAQDQSRLTVLTKELCSFFIELTELRKKLNQLGYDSERFHKTIKEFRSKYTGIKSSFGSVREDEQKTM